MPKDLPSPELLRKLLRYEPETGKLYWRKRTKEVHDFDRGRRFFNSRYAGKEAFAHVGASGYLKGAIYNRYHSAHRIVWAVYYGKWPENQIDHINGDKQDNRISNLRDVSHAENGKNRRVNKNNTSGVTGVSFVVSKGRWVASIRPDGEHIYLGAYIDKKDAVRARKCAERKYGFHENHALKALAESKDD